MTNSRHVEETLTSHTHVAYSHDLKGNFTFLNQEGEQLSGYSCEEACQMNIAQVVPEEIVETVHQELVESIGRPIGSVYAIEIITKNGNRVPLEVSTEVIFRDGQPFEVRGIAQPKIDKLDSKTYLVTDN